MKKEFGFVLAAAILLAGCGQKKETTTTTARPVKTTIVESRSIIRKDCLLYTSDAADEL